MLKIPSLIALIVLCALSNVSVAQEVTDDDRILDYLQHVVELEKHQVDMGRRELKLVAGLTDERSFAVLARAKRLDKEVTVDIPDASKRRLCAKRAQLTTAQKLSAELQTEDERITSERRAATARMRLALSEGERARILEYLAKYSALTVTPPDYVTGLQGRDIVELQAAACRGVE